MNRKAILSLGSALVALGVMSVAGYGCGDDDTASPNKDSGPIVQPEAGPQPEAGGKDSSTPIPAPPSLGAQIDRMGRPAINTALNATFELDAGTKGTKKDSYNQDTAQAGWPAKYRKEFAGNLAVFDGLDQTCGNQLLADPDAGGLGTSAPNAAVYATLSSVTADDRLWLNTGANVTSCSTYLAVEAHAAVPALAAATANDCGGRAPSYDVIDVTYSVTAVGAPAGVNDGVSADATKTGVAAFPYLAAPTQ